MVFLALSSLAQPRRGAAVMLAAGAFVLGVVAGAALAPVTAGRNGQPAEPANVAPRATAQPDVRPDHEADLRSRHPAQVLRVIDGDTFEARVRVWPGLDITTKVRLRGIDAPELKARCEEERVGAESAREALRRMLAEGDVAIARVGLDKYGGRVVAEASTARTADVSRALLQAGVARPYAGGRRDSWCGGH